MKNAKDRLPRDLYINEPELKFNTALTWSRRLRLRHLETCFYRDDGLHPNGPITLLHIVERIHRA